LSGGTKQIALIEQKSNDGTVRALLPSRANLIMKPKWHAPWKLYRVISGHTGWVRAVDVEPNNEWFATGGADRIVKVLLIKYKKEICDLDQLGLYSNNRCYTIKTFN
jgi:WD40 repeat protein